MSQSLRPLFVIVMQVGDELIIERSPTSSKLRAGIQCGVELQAEVW